jgi:hypothetical protein
MMKRLAAMTGMTAAISVISLVVAVPAHANAYDCQHYLQLSGYQIGERVVSACANGQTGTLGGYVICVGELTAVHVNPTDSKNACVLAKAA